MPPDRRSERQTALRGTLEADGLDALLVTHLPNIRYLTGFTGSAALLLVRPDATTLITDFRYAVQAPNEAGSAAVVEIDHKSVWDRLGRLLAAAAPGTLGIEAQALTVRDAQRVADLTRGRVLPTSDLVERLRAIKSPEEVAAIRAAADLAQAALAEVLPAVRPGLTELEIAATLEAALRRRGSEWHPFPTIVASGARADERQRTIYELVRTAQRRALEHLRAGMTGREGDALARDVIAARGFGEAFGHSLGHGLGLEVHEGPRLAPTADAPLPLHAVVTVEPGIYLPGWGGVRLEDDAYLGPDGVVVLSDGRTELVELV